MKTYKITIDRSSSEFTVHAKNEAEASELAWKLYQESKEHELYKQYDSWIAEIEEEEADGPE